MGFMRLECSVWNNGRGAFGVKVLGGLSIRQAHFDRLCSPIIVNIDGIDVEVNIDKKTFWNQESGELIRRPFLDYFERHGLRKGDQL
jgi:hypothetical protein